MIQTFTLSYFIAALAFDAIFILVALIQVILAIHVLRPSNPLQTATYLLIAGCVANIASWSISLVVDIGIVKQPLAVEITEKLLTMTLAIGVLGGLGSALIALALVRIISDSIGGHPWAHVKWLVAIIAFCLAIDLAILGTRYASAITAVQNGLGNKWWYFNVRCLALGAFQLVLYVGWKPAAYEKYPTLLLVKRVVLPAFAIQWTLAIINLVGRTAPGPPTDDAYNVIFGILINAFEPLIVGCLLRVAYVW